MGLLYPVCQQFSRNRAATCRWYYKLHVLPQITQKPWKRFSLNLVWLLCHWRIIQSRASYYFTIVNTNVTDSKCPEYNHLWRHHYTLCCHVSYYANCSCYHLAVLVWTIRAAIYQWPHGLHNLSARLSVASITRSCSQIPVVVWTINAATYHWLYKIFVPQTVAWVPNMVYWIILLWQRENEV